ncbi:T9SS type A sorting domain-containing protein [Olleya sp. YSTF-M6]|uniref:T9SS type A sorting domain-containing protein n=1 Tax=Olleya sediminilitoris TaxID=2795739 RepID=A0ABS1WLH7_9FLAO|nr:YCF48-related protein [Olleya sediminilitoris]MBL7559981.1 T9SS type A sorting domain-containing protein [Olleya sediminilitoris]
MKLTKLLIIIFCIQLNAQTSWQPTPNSINNTNNQRFDDVFFLNDNLGWAANGFYAAVYKTTDGGLTWSEQLNQTDLGSSHYFRNIEFLDENIGFLGTLNGLFYKTIDGGVTWTSVTTIAPNPAAICGLDTVGTNTIYGCGAYFNPAFIIKSTDSGLTWQYIDMSVYADALVEIYFLNDTVGYVAGQNSNGGTLLKTEDGGNTWIEIYNSNTPGDYVWKIQVLESNTDYIFGAVESTTTALGKFIKSTDAGNTWFAADAPETQLQAVGFVSETHGWIGGHTTGFYETTDGGLTWTNLNIGNNLNRIFIVSSTLAYAAGTTIYKYTDQTLGTTDLAVKAKSPLQIKLTKNPVNDFLKFTIHFKANDNLLIELYNTNGKYLKRLTREHITTSNDNKNYSFNVKDLASGIYYLDFHNNSGRQTVKFIKQ